MTTPNTQAKDRAMLLGRALRLLLGLVFLAAVIPAYARVDALLVLRTAILVLGLLAAYELVHVVVSRSRLEMPSWLGATVALVPVVAVYLAGGPGGLLLGRGEGRLASVTFLALSLVVAAARGDPGCEVMSIPAVLFGAHSRLPCIVFSPIDRVERRLRRGA